MRPKTQKAFLAGFAIGGGAVAVIADLVITKAWAIRHAGELGAEGAIGSGIGAMGAAFAGGIGGLLIASIILLVLPRGKTRCPQCQSDNALAEYTSIFNGEHHPNECPQCKHKW